MAKVVLVTGVSRYLGGIVARKLSETPGITKVIGVDVIPPTHDLGRTTFVRADIRNPMIAKVIENDKVDTVVHMNVIATPTSVGGRSPQKEINVIGTMQLLAACQKATSLKRLVVKSSAAVYGATSRDPAMFSEDIEIVTLRLANVIGPRIRTSMTDYFTLPVIPVPMGYDARLQFVHEDDAVAGMLLATTGSMTGTINVAGEGVLTVMQAVSLARRVPVPIVLQATGPVGGFAKRLGLADFSPDQLSLLAFGRGLDTERMHSVLGLEPRYTTREAFVDFISSTRGRLSSAAGKER